MYDLFVENCTLVEEAFHLMSDAVLAFLDQDFEQAKTKTEETILVEKKQDRLREEITERLFSRETMAFSRSDRLKIIESLDKIGDKIEIVVRKLIQFPHDVPDSLQGGIKNIVDKSRTLGTEVKELVVGVLEDFKKGKEHITKITDIRREVREIHWNLLESNYKENYKDFLIFDHNQNLIKDLCKAADRVEDFADQIYGLICKYAL
ncbi:hypothetical protein ES705_15096 [subsurface metagenome]